MVELFGSLLLIIVICIIFSLSINSSKSSSVGKEGNHVSYPYQAIPCLFTPAEKVFLGVIDQIIGSDYRIFGKVRIADVMQVTKGMSRGSWQQAFNRIQSKHFDFVICRAADTAILLLIELDDKSHDSNNRMDRDKFVENAAKAAGLPLLRIRCQKSYQTSEIANLLKTHLPKINSVNNLVR